MEKMKDVLCSVDRIAISMIAGLWLSLVFAWSMPITKSFSEGESVQMIHGENIHHLANSMPTVGKFIVYSYFPLVWEVTPLSFHLVKENDGSYEPEEWSWILMLVTFVISIGFMFFMLTYWQIGQPEELKRLRVKTAIDVFFACYMLFGVVGIYTFL